MDQDKHRQEVDREREDLISQLQDGFEIPMQFLGIVWLALFVIEVIRGLNPLLSILGYMIWGMFILEFVVKLILSPRRLSFLKSNWLSLIALLAPGLRLLRVANVLRATSIVRATRLVRGLRLLRLLTSVNRGMKALGKTMRRRGFGYILLLSLIVTVSGAAAMYSFENNNANGQGLDSYSSALWWTAMIMTTMGSHYWPQTPEGRILCFFLALYSFTMFGYVTATLASFFIGRDAENEEAEVASAKSIAALKEEITALRKELRAGKMPSKIRDEKDKSSEGLF